MDGDACELVWPQPDGQACGLPLALFCTFSRGEGSAGGRSSWTVSPPAPTHRDRPWPQGPQIGPTCWPRGATKLRWQPPLQQRHTSTRPRWAPGTVLTGMALCPPACPVLLRPLTHAQLPIGTGWTPRSPRGGAQGGLAGASSAVPDPLSALHHFWKGSRISPQSTPPSWLLYTLGFSGLDRLPSSQCSCREGSREARPW